MDFDEALSRILQMTPKELMEEPVELWLQEAFDTFAEMQGAAGMADAGEGEASSINSSL